MVLQEMTGSPAADLFLHKLTTRVGMFAPFELSESMRPFDVEKHQIDKTTYYGFLT